MIIDSANLTGSVAIKGQLADPLDFFTREGWVDLMGMVSSILPVFGDVKCSYATTDHNGWYKMTPGRPIAQLPASAQARAATLGFVGQFPYANSMQDGMFAGVNVAGIANGTTMPALFIYLG